MVFHIKKISPRYGKIVISLACSWSQKQHFALAVAAKQQSSEFVGTATSQKQGLGGL
jgi:hypothetical protein